MGFHQAGGRFRLQIPNVQRVRLVSRHPLRAVLQTPNSDLQVLRSRLDHLLELEVVFFFPKAQSLISQTRADLIIMTKSQITLSVLKSTAKSMIVGSFGWSCGSMNLLMVCSSTSYAYKEVELKSKQMIWLVGLKKYVLHFVTANEILLVNSVFVRLLVRVRRLHEEAQFVFVFADQVRQLQAELLNHLLLHVVSRMAYLFLRLDIQFASAPASCAD